MLLFCEDIGDSKEQVRAMQSVTGTLLTIKSLEEESFDTLRQNTVKYCNNLLKKPLQAQAVAKSAYLYWSCQNEEHKNPEFVTKILNKSAKIAKVTVLFYYYAFLKSTLYDFF